MATSQATVQPLLEPHTRIGKFVVIGLAGAGTFGEVYKAYDSNVTQRFVAIKVLRQQIVAGSPEHQIALHELRMLSLVWHPSIVQLADHGLHDDRLWFAMPWIDGESLSSLVSRQGGLPRTQAQQIFEKLAGAIDCLHTLAGIRHQDIKPANVLITKLGDDFFPIMIDFGIGASAAEQHLVGGTPLYVAPEVAHRLVFGDGGAPVSSKADIFSFGLTLMHCLDPSSMEHIDRGIRTVFLEKRARHPPKPPRTRALRDLGDLFKDLIHQDPERRPSASEMVKRLSVLTRAQRQRARMRRRAPWVALGATLIVAIASWTVSLSRQNDRLNRAIDEARKQQYFDDVQYQHEIEEFQRQLEELKANAKNEQEAARRAMKDAEEEKRQADALKVKADAAEQQAVREKQLAETAKQETDKAKHVAETAKQETDKAMQLAETAKQETDRAKQQADKAKHDAATAKQDRDNAAEAQKRAEQKQRDANKATARADAYKKEWEAAEQRLRDAQMANRPFLGAGATMYFANRGIERPGLKH